MRSQIRCLLRWLINHKFNSRMHQQQGQMTIEGILIMTVLLAVATAVSQSFTSQSLLQTVAVGPWLYIRGMAQNGVWTNQMYDPGHPTSALRDATPEGEVQ